MRTDVASPVDPLSDLVEGRYEDELVVVTPRAPNGISHLPSGFPARSARGTSPWCRATAASW